MLVVRGINGLPVDYYFMWCDQIEPWTPSAQQNQ